MIFASLVMDMEDGEAMGENVPTVEELEHFRPEAAIESGSAGHAAGLDSFLRREIGVARVMV
jgi:hypothetical protein